MYSIGYLIYGLDATFSGYGQSDCATQVMRALQAAIAEDPDSFLVEEDELDLLTNEEAIPCDIFREILVESFNCWNAYSGLSESPVAIGIELGTIDVCSNYPLEDVCKKARTNLTIRQDYGKLLDTFPGAFAKRLKEIEPQVFVIWGTS